MMQKTEHYRTTLLALENWDAYLLAESGLPGPRANLELLAVVAELGQPSAFDRWLSYGPELAPVNDPHMFLAVCGAVGLGRLLAEGQLDVLPRLRAAASDPRWRMREGVAMALQRWADADPAACFAEAAHWATGNLLEQRAAAAGVCEPRLLKDSARAREALAILDAITAAMLGAPDRKQEAFKTLRQGLGYCWSVAVVALPEVGKPLLEKWLSCPDPDVRWVMRENLKKARLARMDADWVAQQQARLR